MMPIPRLQPCNELTRLKCRKRRKEGMFRPTREVPPDRTLTLVSEASGTAGICFSYEAGLEQMRNATSEHGVMG